MLEQCKCHLVLGNTYHLGNRPGASAVEELGGLHKFSGWDRAMLTDSGACQTWRQASAVSHFKTPAELSKHRADTSFKYFELSMALALLLPPIDRSGDVNPANTGLASTLSRKALMFRKHVRKHFARYVTHANIRFHT